MQVKLARLEEVPDEGLIMRTHGDRQVLLTKVEGRVYAMNDVCSHQGAPLHQGQLGGPEGDDPFLVTCPWHAAHFDVRTGEVMQECPWATALDAYPVEVREGDVYVEL